MHSLAALAVALKRLPGLPCGFRGPREAARDVDRDDVPTLGQQRLVDGQEVAHRRLRGRGHLVRRPQPVEERRVVADVRLAQHVPAEVHIEGDEPDVVRLHDVGREVRRGVGDDRDRSHAAAQPTPGRRPLHSRPCPRSTQSR